MEDSEEGLEEWKSLEMNSKGCLFSGCAPHNYGEFFYSSDGLEKAVSKSLNFDDGSNSSMVVVEDNSRVAKTSVSIADRRAVKCGFNASKSSTLLPSLSVCVAVSSGVSPHSLLESPMLLPNSQLSPTTGSFASRPLNGKDQMLITASSVDADKGSDGGSSAMYKPLAETSSLACFRDVDNQSQLGYAFPKQLCTEVGTGNHNAGTPPEQNISDDLAVNNSTTSQPGNSNMVPCLQLPPHENGPSMGDDAVAHESLNEDRNGIYPHAGTARTAEDGYNWRKYGQKQVKGSEYPRSYYKCTHPNCPVKKKVERSHDGQITEIIYKGAHNHPKPQPCRKSTLSSIPFNEASDVGNGVGSGMTAISAQVWRSIQSGYKDVIGSDWRVDGLERTSSTSAVTEVSDPLSTTQGKPMGVLESAGTPEFSSTLARHEDNEEDVATQANYLIGHEGDIEPDLKRRKKDCFAETSLGSRAVREPRVVVQIESEIDILDDGYRWRKYGQKVVKGNPNPRSYYKCTTPGCTVRKHVERSSESLKFVITTYEGKHNHEVPAARNSGHANSGSGNLPAAATTQTHLALPRNSHLPKPEPHGQDLPLHFDTKFKCSSDFLRPNILGNLGAGTPYYPMKFPVLPNTVPYGPFGLRTQHPAYSSTMVPPIPDLSFPVPLGYPSSIASYCNPERSHSSVRSLYAGQQLKESENLLRPKQEQRDDSFFDTDMHSINHTNTSSSVHNHVIGNFQS